MRNSRISGVGHYVPERVVTNAELETLMDTTNEWIVERTGIHERRFITPGVDTCASMGTKAAQMALKNARLEPSDIDLIVFATISSEYFFPGSGVLVQRDLGCREIGAIDIKNQCSGFVYALSVGDQFIKTGMYNNVLVIGSEVQSTGLDLTTRGRNVSVIFGDGAGAVILSPENDISQGILSTHIHSEGKFAEELIVKEPGSSKFPRMSHELMDDADAIYPYMNGSQVFKHAVTRFPEAIHEALAKNGYQTSDIDMLIPHQANLRIIQFLQQKMGLDEHKVYSNIQRYGNTTAGSIPIALSEAWHEGKIKKGDLVCFAAFGSGFTWASALIRW